MKKILAILLACCMLFSLAACGEKTDTPPEDEIVQEEEKVDKNEAMGDETEEDEVDDDVTEDVEEDEGDEKPLFDNLVKFEDTYYEDDDIYNVIKNAQGKIDYIDTLTTSATFVTNGEWYIPGLLGKVTHAATIPSNATNLQYFDNMTLGANLIYVVDGKITCVSDSGKVRYSDIPFNTETDMLVFNDSLDAQWITIITKTDNGYTATQWYPVEDEETGMPKVTEDGKYVYEIYESGPIEVFKTGDKGVRDEWVDGYEITDDIVEIFQVANRKNGFETIARTTNNDLYVLEDLHTVFGTWTFEATTYEPWLKDADKLFYIETMFTVPLYSQHSDTSRIFTTSFGESIVDDSDDKMVTFLMPDGLTTKNIMTAFSVSNAVCFIFDNGDVYLTKEMSDDAFAINVSGEFEMFKQDELSEINNTMNFKSFASNLVGIGAKNIYGLTGDGYVYAYDVFDFLYE